MILGSPNGVLADEALGDFLLAGLPPPSPTVALSYGSALSKKTTHVVEGLALLGERFKDKQNIINILTAYLNRVQDFENMVWTVINGYLLPNAAGAQLETLGALVNEPRSNRNDTDYRSSIQVAIRVYLTQGRDVDMIDVGILMGYVFTYTELWPAGWQIDQYGVTTFAAWAADKFSDTKAAGTAGAYVFNSSTQNQSFTWGTIVGPQPPGAGWGDSVAGGIGGTLASVI